MRLTTRGSCVSRQIFVTESNYVADLLLVKVVFCVPLQVRSPVEHGRSPEEPLMSCEEPR